MASGAEIAARLVLNARQFLSQFDGAIDQATQRARAGGRQIGNALSDEANGRLNEFAGRIPLVGTALTGLSGAALGAAAGIGAVTVAIGAGISEAEGYAAATRQLDATLKATGNTTGLTSQQLRDFADELEGSFAIGAEEILKAEQVLASFGGVAGTTFKDTIRLSADLSAVFGGDLAGNAEKLGTVLQNLAQGNVEGLGRGFKFLGTSTIESIEALAKAGRTAEAQRALLDALERTVGGAGEARGQGLSGAFFRLTDTLGDTARAFAENSGLYQAAIDGIDGVTDSVSGLLAKIQQMNRTELSSKALAAIVAPFNPALAAQLLGGSSAAAGAARPGNFSIAAGANQFPVRLGGAGGLDKFLDDAAAAAATRAAGEEAKKQRAAEAAAEAAKKGAAEQEKAAQATARAAEQAERQRQALADQLAELEAQARAAGLTRVQAEQIGTLRRLELQYGKLLSENDRQRVRYAIELRDVLAQGRAADDDRLRGLAGEALPTVLDEAKKALDAAKEAAATGAAEARREYGETFRFLSNSFYDVLSRGAGSFFNTFRELGLRAASDIAAKLLQGQSFSSAVGGGGGGIGGALPFIGLGLGAISLVSNALRRDPFADAFLATGNNGVVASRTRTRGDGRADQAAQLVGLVNQQLQGLAGALGGTVQNGVTLGTIGSNRNQFFFNPTGGDFKGAGRQVFASAEEAAAAAVADAVARGALSGVDAGVARLLSAGDLATQTGKAQTLAAALRQFNQASDPFGAQVRSLTEEFAALRDIMIEAGSSTEQMAQASAEYDRRLQEIRQAQAEATSTLRGFLEELGFGTSSPLALGDQRAAALAAYQTLVGQIGTSGFDQQAFVSAGQRLLDIEGQAFGRSDAFFATFRQVQADTNRAIAAVNNAAGITGDNPFARRTADNTAATADNTAAMGQQLATLNAQIARLLQQGGVVQFEARGFVA